MSEAKTARRIRRRIAALTGDEVLVKLARGGFAALSIKMAAAGLSFLMFLVLARAMSAEEFGRFGFAFSLATLLSVIGSFGQRMVVLRFAPVYEEAGDKAALTGVVRFGYFAVTIGCGALGLAVALFALFWPDLQARVYLIAAGGFTLVLGLAEYQVNVLRAFGGMTLALAPRDIVWRAGLIVVAAAAALGVLPQLAAASGMWVTAGLLASVVAGQALAHPATRADALFRQPARLDGAQWRHAALGLWGASVVNIGAPYFSVVLLGLVLSPASVATYFTALKIATLLGLVTMASSLVAAPMLARNFGAGQQGEAQRVARLSALASAILTGGLFVLIIAFAAPLMGLFGSAFRAGDTLLIILSIGYVFSALSGINVLMMEISGHERIYLRVIMITNACTMAILIPAALWAGPVGAAAVVSAGMIAWNVWLLIEGRRSHGVATSILSLGKAS